MHLFHYVTLDFSKEKWNQMKSGELLTVLQETKTIVKLSLSNLEKISCEFIKELKIALKKNHTITQIDFSQNRLDNWHVAQITSGLLGNDMVKHLNFSFTVFCSRRLFGEDTFSDLLFRLTAMNTTITLNLKNISLNFFKISDLCILLENTASLQILCVSKCNIRSEGAQKVAASLAKNKTLRILDLSLNPIGQQAIEKILEALLKTSSITDLNLADTRIGQIVTDKMVEAVKSNTALTRLDMSRNGFGLEAYKRLADGLRDNNTLKELTLAYEKIVLDTEFVKSLSQNKNLSSLNLLYNKFEDEALNELARYLRNNTTLRELHLSISPNVTVLFEVGKALSGNKTLTALEIKVFRNHLEDNLKQVTIKELVSGLWTCTAMSRLSLSGYQCGPEDAECVAEFLKHNRTLTDLEISDNEIGDKGAESIASALTVNKNLICLDLAKNKIGCRGIEMLAEALKQNRKLEIMNISYNKEGADGVKRFVESLKCNCYLNYLYILGIPISEETNKQLIAGIRHNKTIRVLLYNNSPNEDVGMYLERNSDLLQKVISIANYVYMNRREKELIFRDISKKDFEEFQELQVTREMIRELNTVLQVSFTEAENMITFTHTFIQNHFLEIAGIQEGPLVEFPLLVQNRILSYLKLKDIKDCDN